MTDPAAVRQAICDRIGQTPGLNKAWPFEPEELSPLPCSTLLLNRIDPQEVATGPRLDVTWIWELRIYVGLSDFEQAQLQLETICFGVLSWWRDDPTLDFLVEWWKIADGGQSPVFDAQRRWLRKSLQVQAVIEDVPLPITQRDGEAPLRRTA